MNSALCLCLLMVATFVNCRLLMSSVTSKNIIFITTAVKTSNPTTVTLFANMPTRRLQVSKYWH
jgi:hypothetical protein